MSVIEVKVPDIGDFKEVEVIELLVKAGDTIAAEQSLVTVESDKASMEIPSSAAGVVKALKIKVGDKVSEGSVLLDLETQGAPQGEAASAAAPSAGASAAAPAAAAPAAAPAPSGGSSAPGPAPATAATGPRVVEVPDIGDFKDVEVIELLVKVGDSVGVEQSLITVESDKASMEIPSSAAGVVSELRVKVGDKVSKGTPLLVLQSQVGDGAASSASAASATSASAAPVAAASASAAAAPAASGSAPAPAPSTAVPVNPHPVPVDLRNNENIVKPHASPSVRKFARELGVDLSRVTGTGEKQRILHEDVQGYVKSVMAGATTVAAAASSAPAAGDGA